MDRRKTFLNASALAFLIFAAQAVAADEELLDAPEVTISATAASSSGFYVRGDVGYAGWANGDDPSLSVDGLSSNTSFDDSRFGRPLSGSLGIGYRVNDMVRFDLTGEYFSNNLDASGQASFACPGEAVGTSCGGKLDADYRALGFMANGYVDIATLAGFTPYVGAGIGVTQLRWNDVSLDSDCVPGAAACSGAGSTRVALNGKTDWRFTYALMAGVSYDVTDRLKLDVGYRFSKISDGDLFGGSGLNGFDDGLARHEIRAGLRFSFP